MKHQYFSVLLYIIFLNITVSSIHAQEYSVLNVTGQNKKVLGVDLTTYNGAEITFTGGGTMTITVNGVSHTINDVEGVKISYSENPAIIQRTIIEGGYTTYTPAMDVSPSGDVSVFQVSEIRESSVTINSISGIIPAGEGVLLKGAPGTYNFSQALFPDNNHENFEENLLIGVLENTIVEPYSVYSLGAERISRQVGFWRYSGSTISAGTAYLDTPQLVAARDYLIIYNPEEETTGISDKKNEETTLKTFYNLSGQKANPNATSIVISNGKKILNKRKRL